MIVAIVFLPLLGFLIAGLFGRFIGARPSEAVTTSLLFVACLFSWITFAQVGFGTAEASVPVLGNWFTSGALKVDWALRVDTLTAVMLVVVTTVSALVHLYSIGYMHEDPSRPRFFAYLSLFTFAMLMLVTADNLVQMFFGWEGVGLASYLLIGFWYEKPSANAAAIKAFVVNRVGDFGFALGIFLVFVLTNSVAFETIFAAAPGLARQADPRVRHECRCDDRYLSAALHGRDGQVRAVPAAHLAARCDGRPDTRLGAHPCRDDGDRRGVHGGAAFTACSSRRRRRSRLSPLSEPRRPSSPRPSVSCRTTSSA